MNLKELYARLEKARADARALIDKDGATPEELTQADELIDQAVKLQAEIKAAEARQVNFAQLDNFMNESAGRRSILDVKSASQPAQPREEAPKFKSFGEQLQAVARAGRNPRDIDPRLKETSTEYKNAPSGLSESVPSDGGFLVQADFAAELIKRTYSNSELLGRVRPVTIGANSNRLVWNSINETSRAAGYRWGGVQAYWTDEADTTTATKFKLQQNELQLKKLRAVYYATEELLADATALESLATAAFAEEFDYKIQDAIIRGTGVGMPKGIITDSNIYVQVSKESGQAADTVVYENIIKMWARLYGPSRRNAVWLINQDCEPQLHSMAMAVGTGGAPVYLPPGGLSTSPYAALYGRPVIAIEQCDTVGDMGDIILTDLSQYIWISKGGMDASSSVHVRFLYDEMTYKFVFRCNGMPLWRSSLTPENSSETQSPIVVLQART